ncbi:MAG: hypothetical protein ACI93R_002579 [Flavobacteriales bacterium]|jgi:hypothetical protein
MRYLIGVLAPVLLQSLFVFIVIEMNTGNGSWIGLGALLLGMLAIPATGLVNFVYMKSRKDENSLVAVMRCFLIALALPFIILIFLIVG